MGLKGCHARRRAQLMCYGSTPDAGHRQGPEALVGPFGHFAKEPVASGKEE